MIHYDVWPGCEYGDRVSWCHKFVHTHQDCEREDLIDNCCQTCASIGVKLPGRIPLQGWGYHPQQMRGYHTQWRGYDCGCGDTTPGRGHNTLFSENISSRIKSDHNSRAHVAYPRERVLFVLHSRLSLFSREDILCPALSVRSILHFEASSANEECLGLWITNF